MMHATDALERITGPVPGPRSLALGAELARTETRGVTYLARDYPIFWESASGALVDDVDGNRYLDATAAFGVAITGHANPAVARAIAAQAIRLPHGMGDVHPSGVKAELLSALAALAPVDEPRTFLCSSGAEAVEFALKTIALATGKRNVVAFAGGYHGLSYGTLEIGGIAKFRDPWRAQLRDETPFVRFPDPRVPGAAKRALAEIDSLLNQRDDLGAVLLEPIQGRAGVIVPPDGFLRELAALCARRGLLLALDEIYTGLGRTGTMFACERDGVRPDLLCIGKSLAGGFPLSATIVARRVADAWESSRGEALHTSTFLGNPMGCAAALANLAEIARLDVPRLAREREPYLRERLGAIVHATPGLRETRGRGMLWAVEFADGGAANRCVVRALGLGLILLQSGVAGESITFAPPAVATRAQLDRACDLFGSAAAE